MMTAEQVKNEIRYTTFDKRSTFQPLTADEQRSLWGAVPFGRMRICHNPRRGGVDVVLRTISRDWNYQFVTYQQIADAINRGERVRVCR